MNRILRIQTVRYMGDYRLYLEFNSGDAGEVDLSSDLDGPVFLPLRDREVFATVRLEGGPSHGLMVPTLHLNTWPNDLPEPDRVGAVRFLDSVTPS